MAETPHRARIVRAMLDRLKAIKRVNGFATDAGLALMVGAVMLGPDDPDVAIAVVLGVTDPVGSRTGEHVAESLPIQIAAVAKVRAWADYEDAWMRVEDVLGDIKQAVELPDRTLGGLVPGELRRGSTETLEREEGTVSVGAAITYEALYKTVWGCR